uniref:Uncharacterized protein n=1 Tax=Zea mays TaxID=4577 RepID=A0A804UGQ9_MAIZE
MSFSAVTTGLAMIQPGLSVQCAGGRMAARKLKNFVKGMTKGSSSSSSGRSKAQECLFQGTESLSSNRRQALMEHLPPDMHGQDVNETREEEARGEDAADYDAADADYEQEDDAGGGGGDGWSSGGGQFEGGWSWIDASFQGQGRRTQQIALGQRPDFSAMTMPPPPPIPQFVPTPQFSWPTPAPQVPPGNLLTPGNEDSEDAVASFVDGLLNSGGASGSNQPHPFDQPPPF